MAQVVDRGVPVRVSAYWPHPPSPPQYLFLSLPHLEALYGGAAGGGKTDALLMAALQYVDQPTYKALVIRSTFEELRMELIPRAEEWLAGTDAQPHDGGKSWSFPAGAMLQFGYLASPRDHLRYQGIQWHFVGFDELTHYREEQYRYLFSRLRRARDSGIPTRMRSTSNPGGPGHDWVRQRFLIEGRDEGRVFVPARLTDNPGIDVEDYIASLQVLDHHTRRQLLEGDWESRPPGDLFRRDWFEVIDSAPDDCEWVRFWDLAATEPTESNPDPDYTVGVRVGRTLDDSMVVEHVKRLRSRPQGVEQAIREMADRDGPATRIYIEQEPGSSGKAAIDHYVRTVLPDRSVRGVRATGSKFQRAQVVSSKAEHGLIGLVRAEWNRPLLDELEAFTADDTHPHDDIVDALSGACGQLSSQAIWRPL